MSQSKEGRMCNKPAFTLWFFTQRRLGLLHRDCVMLQYCERRMLRRICGASLADRSSSREVLESCKLENVEVDLRKKRLFWFGYLKSRNENDSLTRVHEMQIPFYVREGDKKNSLAWLCWTISNRCWNSGESNCKPWWMESCHKSPYLFKRREKKTIKGKVSK